MISVIYTRKGLKRHEVWFCQDVESILPKSKADLVIAHGINREDIGADYRNAIIRKQFSLLTDLRSQPEEIFNGFSKNYRYEINRAEKEGVKCFYHVSRDLEDNPDILASFITEYTDFVKIKGIPNSYNKEAMCEYIKGGNILLTRASLDRRNYAQHVYLYDSTTARLLYSVSNFRTKELDSNFVGRANKCLHWHDIQYLYEHKVEILDWGGISSIENPNGVDRFKRGFGGKECAYYNVTIGKSLIGRAAISIMKSRER